MANLLDYLAEGKLDQNGIIKIQKIIDENEKLKNAFTYSSAIYSHRNIKIDYYTKEEFESELIKQNEDLSKLVESLRESVYSLSASNEYSKRTISYITECVRGKCIFKIKKIKNILGFLNNY
jgi:hypothetical protein